MKFIHIADVHLGAKPDAGKAYSANRESEIWDAFRNVIQLCEKEQTELLLIAGDLFHRQPLLRELKEVDYLLGSLSRTQVVLAAGNHDYIKKNSYYRTFVWSSNVHMIFEKDKKNMTCYTTPYGSMMMGIDARSISIEESDDEIHAQIQYALDVNYEHLADCTISLSVQSKEQQNFSIN